MSVIKRGNESGLTRRGGTFGPNWVSKGILNRDLVTKRSYGLEPAAYW